MDSDRSDSVTSALTTLVSIAYFGLMAGAALVLVGSIVVKLAASNDADWTWGLQVAPVSVDAPTAVTTRWGPAQLEVEDVRGSLRLPIGNLPWWLMAILWTHAATAFGLMLVSLHNLRRIFQRVREGAPFDARNAQRLRWLGLSLLGLAAVNSVAELVTSMAVRRGLSATNVTVPVGLPLDASLVFTAFVLVALARIFRRGADLEHEQSLVV